MAMPTSAAASAGASLTPSPAMATRRPSLRRRCTTSPLRSGRTRPRFRRCRAADATARAVVELSPVSITIRRPSARKRRERGLCRRLDRIGDRDDAGGTAVDRDKDRGRAGRCAVRRGCRAPASRYSIHAISAALPSATALPSTVPVAPLPDTASEIADIAPRTSCDPGGRRGSRAPADARCPARRWRQAAAALLVERRRPDDDAITFGLPSVSVPVLSITSVSMRSNRSSASASRIRMPAARRARRRP